MGIDYHKKYLKYKKKYLEAKKMYGGLSKIEGGGFGLGQGNQGQDKESWKGGWRFRPKGNLPPSKEPNPSTRIEIELWEYLWTQGLLPNNVVKEINNFLNSPDGLNPSRHWVPTWLNKMLYRDTINAFPEIIRKVRPEEAIYIMDSLTKILKNRIKEEEVKFKESNSWVGHTQTINDYIVIYDRCIIIMNKNNLFNDDKKEKSNAKNNFDSKRRYVVILQEGKWHRNEKSARKEAEYKKNLEREALMCGKRRFEQDYTDRDFKENCVALLGSSELYEEVSAGQEQAMKIDKENFNKRMERETYYIWTRDKFTTGTSGMKSTKEEQTILLEMYDRGELKKLLKEKDITIEELMTGKGPGKKKGKKVKDILQKMLLEAETAAEAAAAEPRRDWRLGFDGPPCMSPPSMSPPCPPSSPTYNESKKKSPDRKKQGKKNVDNSSWEELYD